MRTTMDLSKTQGEKPLHTFTWSESKQPSSAVIIAIADVTGEDPLELEPLYSAIDPDALNNLFTSTRLPRHNGSVSFNYHGFQVTINADGHGFLSEQDESHISLSQQTEENL